MADLIEFLRARFAEDERVARAAGWHVWCLGEGVGVVLARSNGRFVAERCREYDATHIARHDPARVLREVEAKGRIVDYIEVVMSHGRHDHELLGALALPYSDHADYREEWRP